MRRRKQNPKRFSKKFNRKSSRTKAINLAPPPMRGGTRL